MNPGDRVQIEHPGHACHKRIGTVIGPFHDESTGHLIVVECEGFIPIGFPASSLRIISEQAA